MTGRLAFATALSNRVADWIRSTNPVSDVISTPRPGVLLGERLAKDDSVERVGVLELDALPAEDSDDLGAAAPTIRWVDGSAQFAMVRRDIDPTEQQILMRSDAIAVAALDQVNTATISDAGTLAGLIERQRALPAPRRPISPSRPIWPPTEGWPAYRSRYNWRIASPCVHPSPTKELGSGARAHSRGTIRLPVLMPGRGRNPWD